MKENWRDAPLAPADAALMDYAEKLTRTPWSATRDDLERLRGHGLTDEQISDAVQIIGYFNYINRVADGLGVDLEEGMPAREPRAAPESAAAALRSGGPKGPPYKKG